MALWMSALIVMASCGAVGEGPDTTFVDQAAPEEEESHSEVPDDLWGFLVRSPSCADCDSAGIESVNIATFDGLRYQVPIAGDFVAVLARDRSVAVQLRIDEGVITKVAAVLTDYPVEIDGAGALTIDGRIEDIPSGSYIPLIDNAAIFRDGDVYILAWPGEGEERFRLDVTAMGSDLRIDSFLPPELAGSVGGLNGDGDGSPVNDLAMRSGAILEPNATHDDLLAFAESWRVGADESLFGCEPDEFSAKNGQRDFDVGC